MAFASMDLPEELRELDYHTDPTAKPLSIVFQDATEAVGKLGMFSTNEEEDDIATKDMKYLLVPFYQGMLLTKTTESEPAARKAQLEDAMADLRSYLGSCERYGLLGPQASALWQALRAPEEAVRLDPGVRRQQKVAQWKREREVNSALAELWRRKAEREMLEMEEGAAAADEMQEEEERQLWRMKIELSALQACRQMGLVAQEVQLLAHAVEQRKAAGGLRPQEQQAEPAGRDEERALMLQQLRKIAGSLSSSSGGNSSASQQREQLRRQVFRPSHILPTFTPEQAGLMELKEAQEREARQAAAERARAAAREAAGSDEDEEELRKQRSWDDWKDSNPRGIGNSKLKPCS